MNRLDGKVAIVTGAARGIGQQIAVTLARQGASVAIATHLLSLEESEREIRRAGGKCLPVRADVTKATDVDMLVERTVQEFGRVDILVNNAGYIRRKALQDMTEDDWDTVVDVNLKGPFLLIRAVARHMIAQKYGKVVNIASIAAFSAIAAPASYVASKTGLIGLTRAAARDLGPYGINVNAVAPGTVVTDMTYTDKDIDKHIVGAVERAVLHRTGTPQDIANIVVFLASDESSFITGQTIVADGGRIGIVS